MGRNSIKNVFVEISYFVNKMLDFMVKVSYFEHKPANKGWMPRYDSNLLARIVNFARSVT